MRIEYLEQAIRKSWGADTCYPGSLDAWSLNNPAIGQCTVTALIVQDYFGGEILHCDHLNHNWNKIPGIGEVDLSREQFPAGTVICADGERTREDLLESEKAKKAGTPERYEVFRARVKNLLGLKAREGKK